MDDSNFMSGFVTGDAMGRNNNCNNGWGGMFGGEGMWLFALLLLPMMWGGGFGGWGNNGRGNPVTEADLCQSQSFAELKSSVGRGFDQQTQFAFQNQRDLCTSTATLSGQMDGGFSALERLISNCCCETKQIALENRYLAAQNTAAINATTVSENQKVLDAICGLRMEMKDDRIGQMQNQINQLQLNAALCGVVRYPNQTAFFAQNPFFGCCNSGGCCGNGNI